MRIHEGIYPCLRSGRRADLSYGKRGGRVRPLVQSASCARSPLRLPRGKAAVDRRAESLSRKSVARSDRLSEPDLCKRGVYERSAEKIQLPDRAVDAPRARYRRRTAAAEFPDRGLLRRQHPADLFRSSLRLRLRRAGGGSRRGRTPRGDRGGVRAARDARSQNRGDRAYAAGLRLRQSAGRGNDEHLRRGARFDRSAGADRPREGLYGRGMCAVSRKDRMRDLRTRLHARAEPARPRAAL